MVNDVRLALRQHRRQPGFALTVVCTLGIAIGATAAVFSILNAVLLRALPFEAPEQLVWVESVRTDSPNAPFSLPEFLDYRAQTRTLSGLAAYATWGASLAGDDITHRLQGARMSANAFGMLGAQPAAGRLLNERDDRSDAPLVVVLSYSLWQRHYGGAADIVGKPVRINGESYTVVGVLPAQFPLPLRQIEIVTPLAPSRDPLRHERNSVNFLRLFGRLQPGVEAQQAQSELTTICRSLRQQFPAEYARKQAVRVQGLHEALVGDFRQSILILFAAVTMVLAAALANLASVALVRAHDRRSELATRIVLGASRVHLARQLTVEALLLATFGSVLGWLVAMQAVRVTVLWAPASIPRLGEVTLHGAVALFVLAVSALVVTLLTVATLGAIGLPTTLDGLRPTSRGAIGNRWNYRVRNVMVVAEISAAVVLLVATSVLLQNLRQLRDLDPGFNPDRVFQARVSLPPTYASVDDVSHFYESVTGRILAGPGVEQTGVISVAPLSGLLFTVPFFVAGESTAERDRSMANLRAVSPGYLETVRTRLLKGRAFSDTDRSNTPPVALVSAALANRFPGGLPLGRQVFVDDNNAGPRALEVVGVVENVRHTALDLPPAFDIYIPLRQVHTDGLPFLRSNQFWMVRTHSAPGAFRATFVAHVRAVDPDAAVSEAGTTRRMLDDSLGPRRFNLQLFGAFAATTVVLAVLGLYGLVSYAVSQRAPEIGLRLAIGASQRDVYRMVLRQAATLGLVGAAAGLWSAMAIRPVLSRVARDAQVDPGTAVAVAGLLIVVVLIAAWLPARRAARIEPTLALKAP